MNNSVTIEQVEQTFAETHALLKDVQNKAVKLKAAYDLLDTTWNKPQKYGRSLADIIGG